MLGIVITYLAILAAPACFRWLAKKLARHLEAAAQRICIAGAILVFSASAQGAVIIDQVNIGNPGNADNLAVGSVGAVDYSYNLSKYEVTNQQYTAFLNATAKTDSYGEYSTMMNTDPLGGITRTGSSGSYVYSVKPTAAFKPVNFVSYYDACRFANWMSNGQPGIGTQTGATTEGGAYTLNGAISGTAIQKNAISPRTGAAPLYWLPNVNEWYKGAYWDQSLNPSFLGEKKKADF